MRQTALQGSLAVGLRDNVKPSQPARSHLFPQLPIQPRLNMKMKNLLSVDYGDQTLTIPIQKGDSTPPTISANVKRVNQNEGNGNWAILEIEASSKDNYDPNPTLVFEPVLANQRLQNGDVIVNAKRRGWKVRLKNVVGRTYQLRITSQDASENTSTSSFDHVVRR